MAGDFFMTNPDKRPKDVECPWCERDAPVKRRVTVPVSIWGSEEVQYASLDEDVYNKIMAESARWKREFDIMLAQRRFRVNKSLIQSRRRFKWM